MGPLEMKELLQRLFIYNWPRKLVALFTAVLVWFIVSQSITVTRTIADIPVRITNLPHDKTVVGLLPTGLLNRRISITITGTKPVVKDLRATDLEVVINADSHKESWIASISKRNLTSLNQEIDLRKHISDVEANDLFIKLSKLVTEDVPVTVTKPIGDPPSGYQFIDVWPKYLTQKVSGPEEQVRELKQKGLELTFNLSRVTADELNSVYEREKKDEIIYPVPESWKKVTIPFKDYASEPLNDPKADLLRIDFLKQDLIPLNIELPITIFFPVKYSQTINPQTYSLETNGIVEKKNGLKRLTIPLYVRDVSHLFLKTVRDNLLLIIVAAPSTVQDPLSWTIEFVNDQALEETFINETLKQIQKKYSDETLSKYSEEVIRSRFTDYLRKLVLYTEDGKPLQLQAELKANTITLQQLQ